MAFGDETVTFAEVDQELCTRTYGEAPCTAKLGVTGTRKCHNTRKTCQDTPNYLAQPLTLRFASDQDGLREYGYVIPSLVDVRTTPARINLAAMNDNAAALGGREQVTMRFRDHRHSDLRVDKYRTERSFVEAVRWPGRFSASMFRRQGPERIARAAFFGYHDSAADPYKVGTHWGKFIARNPYYPSFACRVRDGVVGQALTAMRVRNYVLDRVEGPTDGQVTVVAKDLFSKIESRKAVAPFPSLGELTANMTGTPATFTVGPTGIGSLTKEAGGYAPITSTAGYVAIGDEIIKVTRSGDTFTVVTRAALGSKQQDHDDDDLVQLVLEYNAQFVHDIIYDLLTVYSFIEPASIDKPKWNAAAAGITDLFTGHLVRPTPVEELVGQLSQQAGASVFHDVTTGMIEFVPLSAAVISPTVTDRSYVVDGSLSVRRDESQRVSSVWVYYGIKDRAGDVDDERNYHSRLVVTDLNAAQFYGSDEIRRVFSIWIPQFGRNAAERAGDRILAMFKDPPVKASFKVTADRASNFSLARYFFLKTAELQDEHGAEKLVPMATISMARGENEVAIEAQSISLSFTEDPIDNTRRIFIENATQDLNLRTVHDTLFAAPVSGDVVEVTVESGVIVSSTAATTAAMRTGTWPSGVTLTVINKASVRGKGGNGGGGGIVTAGSGGQPGGTAFLAEYACTFNNTNGALWGGGGGGGGGGGSRSFQGGEFFAAQGGSGGGGAGTNVGTGATNGTATTGGSGGAGESDGPSAGGNGGNGGALGQAGTSGTAGSGGNVANYQGGGGGAAGKYAEGNSLITWAGFGERIGGVS